MSLSCCERFCVCVSGAVSLVGTISRDADVWEYFWTGEEAMLPFIHHPPIWRSVSELMHSVKLYFPSAACVDTRHSLHPVIKVDLSDLGVYIKKHYLPYFWYATNCLGTDFLFWMFCEIFLHIFFFFVTSSVSVYVLVWGCFCVVLFTSIKKNPPWTASFLNSWGLHQICDSQYGLSELSVQYLNLYLRIFFFSS